MKTPQTAGERVLWARWTLLVYNVVVLAVLLLIWYAYEKGWGVIGDLVRNPAIRVAFHAVWFAMLGGVAISFKGITDHWQTDEWPRGRWGLWYVSRPLNGIIVGAVVYLGLQVANTSSPPSTPSVSIAAFVLGTQEKRFYTFIATLGKVLLTVPGGDGQDFDVTQVIPRQGRVGDPLMVMGSGLIKGTTLTLGGAVVTDVQVAPDGTALVGSVPAGAGTTDVVVALPDGTARTVKKGFEYQS